MGLTSTAILFEGSVLLRGQHFSSAQSASPWDLNAVFIIALMLVFQCRTYRLIVSHGRTSLLAPEKG